MDPVNTLFNTENIKIEQNINTEQDSRGKEDVHKNINTLSYTKKWDQAKQNHNEYMDKKVIWSLKKLYTSYNPTYLNCINETFKDMIIEDTSQ